MTSQHPNLRALTWNVQPRAGTWTYLRRGQSVLGVLVRPKFPNGDSESACLWTDTLSSFTGTVPPSLSRESSATRWFSPDRVHADVRLQIGSPRPVLAPLSTRQRNTSRGLSNSSHHRTHPAGEWVDWSAFDYLPEDRCSQPATELWSYVHLFSTPMNDALIVSDRSTSIPHNRDAENASGGEQRLRLRRCATPRRGAHPSRARVFRHEKRFRAEPLGDGPPLKADTQSARLACSVSPPRTPQKESRKATYR